MKLMITGAGGFIGQALLELIKESHSYLVQDTLLLTSRPLPGFQCMEHKDYQYTIKDIKNAGIDEIDTVLHIGAYIPKSTKDADDVDRCTSNVENTRWLVNHLPSCPRRFIFISTVDVYDPAAPLPVSEESPCVPVSLYGWSKLYCEKMLAAWAKAKDVQLQILRLGHIYGPGEDAYQKLIPITIRNILKGESPRLFTTGEEHRAFLHVQDCCRCILASVLGEGRETVNLVSAQSLSVKQLIQTLIEISRKDVAVIEEHKQVPGRSLYFDNKKMLETLGEEEITFKDGILEEFNYFMKKNAEEKN